MNSRKSLPVIAGIILICAAAAFAQEAQTQTPSPDSALRQDRSQRMERRRERLRQREGIKGGERRDGMERHGGGMGHMLRDLNLSDAQRQQSRAIMQRRLQSTKAQREELFKLREKRIDGTFSAEDEARAKALHQEIRTAMRGVREEMAGVLTAEQKTKLEQMKNERKEKRMKERQERLNNKPQ